MNAQEDFSIQSSWATEPYFYAADHPEQWTPFRYQEAGVEYALARDHVLFGDAPGLGKTAESILLGNAIGAKKTLVICPASLRLNWEREIWRWSTLPNVSTYPIFKASNGVSDAHNYIITSYSLICQSAIHRALMSQKWDHLILDEAHALKDPKKNKRVHAICDDTGLRSVAGRITLASGTILPNQPIECYNVIRMLAWDAIDRASLQEFRETYYALGEGWVFGPVVKYDARGHPYTVRERHWSDQVRNVPRNLDDLQYRLRKNIMVRRRKDQVLHQLPPKQWHVFPMAITPEMRAAMKHPGWLEAQALYELDPDSFDRNVPIDGAISTAMRLLGEAMAPSMADYVDELFEGGVRKLVVGAFHRSVLTYLHERLKRYGVVYMDGGTSDRKKQWAVDEFQTKDEIGIMLGQMLPLGEGWTLTQAQDVLFAESYWVPGKMEQLLDRIHRIGQDGLYVCGHVPVVPGSIMERQLGTLVEKERNIHAALDG
jgi:SWI/SNF-related matrix-associated actin-dependent regulator 1 of chromatin subfamily A